MKKQIISVPKTTATFITGIFDPNDVLFRPGIYTTYSNTEAYPILMAMIDSKLVEELNTLYLPNAIEQIIVKSKPNRKYSKRNPSSSTPAKVFVEMEVDNSVVRGEKAKLTYTGWKEAWWREAIQNSRDAKATQIDCGAIKQSDGTWLVWCDDNGLGMDVDTLVKAYFAMGGSGKASGATIGGFGKAKEILLLPWIRFKVVTRDIIAESERETRTRKEFASVTTGAPYKKGTRLEVAMPADNFTAAPEFLIFMKKCNITGVKITFTGYFGNPTQPGQVLGKPETKEIKANLRTGKTTAFEEGEESTRQIKGAAKVWERQGDRIIDKTLPSDTLLGTIYIRKQPKEKIGIEQLLVRDGGIFMFGRDIPSGLAEKFIFVLELEIPAKFVMTENRDSFSNRVLDNAVYHFIQDLIKKEEDAFNKEAGLFFEKFYGEGGFKAYKQEKKKRRAEITSAEAIASVGTISTTKDKNEIVINITPENVQEIVKVFEESNKEQVQENIEETEGEKRTRYVVVSTGFAVEGMISHTKIKGAEQVNNIIRQAAWQPNFGVLCEIKPKRDEYGNLQKYKVDKKFFPEYMTPGVMRIAKYWTEFIKYVLGQLNVYREFNVGFVFTDSAQAMYKKDSNEDTGQSEDWVMINPYYKEELLKPTTNDDHLKLMYAAAIHECTHMASGLGDYDKDFPVALTYNFAACADFREARKLATKFIKAEAETASGIKPVTKEEYGIFAQIGPSKRGRPKQINSIGNSDSLQIRYMWENKPEDGPNEGTEARVQVIVNNNSVWEGTRVFLIDTLETMSDALYNILWERSMDMVTLFQSTSGNMLTIDKQGQDRVVLHTTSGDEYTVDKKIFKLVLDELGKQITGRLNFVISSTRSEDARRARENWKLTNKRWG